MAKRKPVEDFEVVSEDIDFSSLSGNDTEILMKDFSSQEQQEETSEEEIYYEETENNEFSKASGLGFFSFRNIIIGLAILLVLFFVIYFLFLKTGDISGIRVTVPDIIYTDEKAVITGQAIGNGNLRKTRYDYSVSNGDIVWLSYSTTKGKKINNTLNPLSDGKFTLQMTASLKGVILDDYEKEVIICKKLTNTSVAVKELVISQNKTSKIDLDLGTAEECYQDLSFVIADPLIASFKDDEVTGLAQGQTTLTIKKEDQKLELKIIVEKPSNIIDLEALELNKTSTTIEVGTTEKLTVVYKPKNTTQKNVSWASEDSTIATVSSTGVIKGIKAGKTIVTVTSEDGKYSASVTVNVIAKKTIALKGITLSKSSITLETGKTSTISVNYNPSNASNKSVAWTSANNNIATVNNGTITAKAVGTTTISATSKDGAYKASVVVNVISALSNNNYLSALSITGRSISPIFNKNTLSYTLTVPNSVTSVVINATKEHAKATITGGTGTKALVVGSNIISVIVKAENGSTRTYKITITRQTISCGAWSSWTTTSCNISNTNTCERRTTYSTRTTYKYDCDWRCDWYNQANPPCAAGWFYTYHSQTGAKGCEKCYYHSTCTGYNSWSSYTTTPCSVNGTTCQSRYEYRSRTCS